MRICIDTKPDARVTERLYLFRDHSRSAAKYDNRTRNQKPETRNQKPETRNQTAGTLPPRPPAYRLEMRLNATLPHDDPNQLPSAETLLRQPEALVRLLEFLGLSYDAIFLRDMQSVITYWSSGAERLY